MSTSGAVRVVPLLALLCLDAACRRPASGEADASPTSGPASGTHADAESVAVTDCVQPCPACRVREQRLMLLVNQARRFVRGCDAVSRGTPPKPTGTVSLPELLVSPELECAARRHSVDMASTGHFAHRNLDRVGPSQRAARAGYTGRAVRENLAWGQAAEQVVLDEWLASPAHCEALFSSDSRHLGAGFAMGAGDKPFWALLLGAP